jgi:hypothetical protein
MSGIVVATVVKRTTAFPPLRAGRRLFAAILTINPLSAANRYGDEALVPDNAS